MSSSPQTPANPSDIRLRYDADRRVNFVLLPLMLLLFAGGVALALAGKPGGWFLMVIFGLISTGLFLQLMPGSSYLEIDTEKLTICVQFKQRHYYWVDVKELGIQPIGYFEVVGLRLMPKSVRKYGIKIPARKGEWDVVINNRYNLPSRELVQQLNKVRSALVTDTTTPL